MVSVGQRRAFVLGGGVAGIAAALGLADRGFAVELIEGRSRLGGRAFTLPDRDTVERCDNGPHVMLGGYAAMRRLLRRLGTEASFEQPPVLELTYAAADGRAARLALPPGPAPLMFGPALLRFRGLRLVDRLRALRGLAAVVWPCPAEWTVEDWIVGRRQQGGPRDFLWDPMCRAIMNAEADRVGARCFLHTLRRAFLGRGRHAAIWLPIRPWSEIIDEPAARALATAGVRVRTGVAVRELAVEEGRLASIGCGGETIAMKDGDVAVSALPWHVLGRLLGAGALPGVGLAASPIVSVYFEADVDPGLPGASLVALVGGSPFHFLARRPAEDPRRFAVLSGGGADLVGLSVAAMIDAARAQLVRHFPDADPEVLRRARARLAKEAAATIVHEPTSDAVRPVPGRLPGIEGLLVCGDWTRTGLPSTLEGAVESAERALTACDEISLQAATCLPGGRSAAA
ncbi:MAG: hydroxysqualene dehydroxylase HpnE, partial [Planctomycetota bacterium]